MTHTEPPSIFIKPVSTINLGLTSDKYYKCQKLWMLHNLKMIKFEWITNHEQQLSKCFYDNLSFYRWRGGGIPSYLCLNSPSFFYRQIMVLNVWTFYIHKHSPLKTGMLHIALGMTNDKHNLQWPIQGMNQKVPLCWALLLMLLPLNFLYIIGPQMCCHTVVLCTLRL